MQEFLEKNNIIFKGKRVTYRNIEKEKNISKPFRLTLESLRQQLREIEYDKVYSKFRDVDEEIENYKMYPFAFAYYYYVAIHEKIPKPNEFIEQYFNLFCEEIDGKYQFREEYILSEKNIIFTKERLVPRILRSYNSFNRELEFLLNFRRLAKGSGIRIWYDMKEDLFNGIDFVISYKNQEAGIATYVGTKRSIDFKERKNTIRHDYSEIHTYDLIAIFSGPDKNVYQNGDVFTYSDKAVLKLIRTICNECN